MVYGIFIDEKDFWKLKEALNFTFNHKCEKEELDEETEVFVLETLTRMNDLQKILQLEESK